MVRRCVQRALLLGCVGVALLQVSCGSSGPPFEPVQAADDLAVVYIYRTQRFGAANRPAVKIDGRQVTQLVPKGYSAHRIRPHRVEISASSTELATEKQDALTIDAEAGATYYVRGHLGSGRYAGAPVLTLVDDATGSREIRRCRRVE